MLDTPARVAASGEQPPTGEIHMAQESVTTTDSQPTVTEEPIPLGRAFAEAIAGKDFPRARELFASELDFRALTPRREWQATTPEQLVTEILSHWFEDSDHVEELAAVDTGSVADRERLVYRLHGHNEDGPFVVEQQAYYTVSDGRIDWMRVVCSGYRPR